MPPPTTHNPSQVAEISRLSVRLSVAQNKRGPLLQTLRHLQTQHANQNAELSNIRNQIEQAQQEAQSASSNNLRAEYHNKLKVVTELKWRLASSLRKLDESMGKIEKSRRDLIELDQETSGLQRILQGLRAGGN